jgi:hypothetical protein
LERHVGRDVVPFVKIWKRREGRLSAKSASVKVDACLNVGDVDLEGE